jgi:hypothetical protein
MYKPVVGLVPPVADPDVAEADGVVTVIGLGPGVPVAGEVLGHWLIKLSSNVPGQ